eukprot:TRINITY_DN24954_c0_g1_i1.p2 TRINITY_DN24954_c0_g1~~TRINITY_DN24954_c0_g1_i1.p2  ORF type:complete len:118 (+),score=48.10 TRINITY_DN24954_c0_g1_i1:67-420(+)
MSGNIEPSQATATQPNTAEAGAKAAREAWDKSSVGDWKAPAPSNASLAQTASTAVRSSVSEVAELNKSRKLQETPYVCGLCVQETVLRPGDPVMCQSCGDRILYKKRGTTPVQYAAV